MDKVYVVVEVQDLYTIKILGVCSTLEIAEQLKAKNEESWNLEGCEITITRFNEMLKEMKNVDPQKTLLEMFIEAYPEYPVTELEKAIDAYLDQMYIITEIKKVPLFNNINDVTY